MFEIGPEKSFYLSKIYIINKSAISALYYIIIDPTTVTIGANRLFLLSPINGIGIKFIGLLKLSPINIPMFFYGDK